MACSTCKKSDSKCSCKRPAPCDTCCKETISTDCVIYDNSPHPGQLGCFLGLGNKTTATKIIETLEKKLCIKPSECSRIALGLGSSVSADVVIYKLLEYICGNESGKVKITANDKKPEYLWDSITVGPCLKKEITQDIMGNQQMHISLDLACISTYIGGGGNNTAISISGVNVVCGNNTTILTASTNCTGTITWSNGLTGPTIQASAGNYYATCGGVQSNVITVTNTGNCGCIVSDWNNTGATRCQNNVSEIEQISNCGSYRWISGGTGCNQPPCVSVKFQNVTVNPVTLTYNCQGISNQVAIPGQGCVVVTTTSGDWSYPVNTLVPTVGGTCSTNTYTQTRTQSFTRNNCPSGCTGGSVSFTKNYVSAISQLDADNQASGDSGFITQGQAYANSNGSCTGGSCSGNAYSATRTETFVKNNCPSGCTGSSVSFTKSYTSNISQADANTQAANDATYASQGQFNANNVGTCSGGSCSGGTFTSTRTQNFTKTNCPSGCTGSVVGYSQTYTSNVSQIDANNLANNDPNYLSNGQSYANTNGSCSGGSCSGCPSIVLSGPASPLSFIQGTAITNINLNASGGTAPYIYSLLSGSLPAGLSLSNTGVLSGTPTTAGTGSFTVRAVDANSCPSTTNLIYQWSVNGGGCTQINSVSIN